MFTHFKPYMPVIVEGFGYFFQLHYFFPEVGALLKVNDIDGSMVKVRGSLGIGLLNGKYTGQGYYDCQAKGSKRVFHDGKILGLEDSDNQVKGIIG